MHDLPDAVERYGVVGRVLPRCRDPFPGSGVRAAHGNAGDCGDAKDDAQTGINVPGEVRCNPEIGKGRFDAVEISGLEKKGQASPKPIGSACLRFTQCTSMAVVSA